MNKNNISYAITIALLGGFASTGFAEVTLYDYEEATSAYEDAYVSGRLNINNGNQDQTSHDLNIDLNYERVYSSPSHDTELDANLQASSTRGSSKGDSTQESYLGSASVSRNTYFVPGSNGAFWYGDADLAIKKGADDPRLAVGIGVGYGRVVNVTPMAQALRLVEALQQKDRIRGSLSKSDYNKVANIIAKESAYRSKYGGADYQQYWIADIEKALKASGKTQGTLGAIGILKAHDVLINERISTRKHGWRVKAGVSEIVRDFNGSKSKPALDLEGEYHRPLSNSTQFSNEAALSTVLKNDDKSYHFNNSMSLTHEISDRVDWLNSWNIDYDHNDKLDKDTTTNALSSTYRYYISNKLAFDTVLALTNVEDDIDNNGNDKVDKSLFMGITYRLK